jgi:hypothetical protein
MKTSIEWLWEQIPFEFTSKRSAFEVFEQAKEMHKQEIIKGYHIGYSDAIQANPKQYDPEQYYQETFKKD